jgi:hypothetical protein
MRLGKRVRAGRKGGAEDEGDWVLGREDLLLPIGPPELKLGRPDKLSLRRRSDLVLTVLKITRL